MMPPSEHILATMRDYLSPVETSLAVYKVGSYRCQALKHDELDLVVLLNEPGTACEYHVVSSLEKVSSRLPLASVLNICNAFIPRSYNVPLTIHCAIYKREELIIRRPRIIQTLIKGTPVFGDCSWLPELGQLEWTLWGLMVERWGVLDSLTKLQRGQWAVDLWDLHEGKVVKNRRVLSLDDPQIHIEFLWYTSSKLTLNVTPYLPEDSRKSVLESCNHLLDALYAVVVKMRNDALSYEDWERAKWLWWKWSVTFFDLLKEHVHDPIKILNASR